jgi:hypothetical protein
VVEPNRLEAQVDAGGTDSAQRDRPISPRLPLLSGAGLVIAGLAMFAAGTSAAQQLGLGLASLGGGIAMLAPLLRTVRDLRGNPVWARLPAWLKAVGLLYPVGLAVGVVMLVGFGLFALAVVALDR